MTAVWLAGNAKERGLSSQTAAETRFPSFYEHLPKKFRQNTTSEWFVHLPEVVFVLFFSSVEHGGSTKAFKKTKEERCESIFVSMLYINSEMASLEPTFYGLICRRDLCKMNVRLLFFGFVKPHVGIFLNLPNSFLCGLSVCNYLLLF